ncbi:hypothetical protein T484DRAFT_1914635, partial [Baffinella frigidus]
MRVLALVALLVAPCDAFFHGGGAGSRLALRSREARLGAQRPFHARQPVAPYALCALPRGSRQLVAPCFAGGQLVAGGWRSESRVTLRMGGRVGAESEGGREGDPLHAGQLTGVIRECSELGELALIVQEQRGVLGHLDVSAAWVCLARIESGEGETEVGEVVAALQVLTWGGLDQMDGGGVAELMRSMAQLHDSRWSDAKGEEGLDRGLLEAMQRRAMATAGELTPQDVGRLLWALAKLGKRVDRDLMEAMQRRATETAGEFDPDGVANCVLWALAMGER